MGFHCPHWHPSYAKPIIEPIECAYETKTKRFKSKSERH